MEPLKSQFEIRETLLLFRSCFPAALHKHMHPPNPRDLRRCRFRILLGRIQDGVINITACTSVNVHTPLILPPLLIYHKILSNTPEYRFLSEFKHDTPTWCIVYSLILSIIASQESNTTRETLPESKFWLNLTEVAELSQIPTDSRLRTRDQRLAIKTALRF